MTISNVSDITLYERNRPKYSSGSDKALRSGKTSAQDDPQREKQDLSHIRVKCGELYTRMTSDLKLHQYEAFSPREYSEWERLLKAARAVYPKDDTYYDYQKYHASLQRCKIKYDACRIIHRRRVRAEKQLNALSHRNMALQQKVAELERESEKKRVVEDELRRTKKELRQKNIALSESQDRESKLKWRIILKQSRFDHVLEKQKKLAIRISAYKQGLSEKKALLEKLRESKVKLSEELSHAKEQFHRIREKLKTEKKESRQHLTRLKGLETVCNLSDREVQELARKTGISVTTETGELKSDARTSLNLRLSKSQWLDLSYTKISNLNTLVGLTQLEWLDLGYTNISDVDVLAGLPQLQTLYLSHTDIIDLEPLAESLHLQTLYLNDTNIRDLRPLENLTRLKTLDLGSTGVTDITALAKLTHLEMLDLSNTPLRDITPLSGLHNLELLCLGNSGSGSKRYSDITPEQIAALREQLPQCAIY